MSKSFEYTTSQDFYNATRSYNLNIDKIAGIINNLLSKEINKITDVTLLCNCLERIPYNMGILTNLETLRMGGGKHLEGDQIAEFLDILSGLQKLTYFRLSHIGGNICTRFNIKFSKFRLS